jgi:hypothetical protein
MFFGRLLMIEFIFNQKVSNMKRIISAMIMVAIFSLSCHKLPGDDFSILGSDDHGGNSGSGNSGSGTNIPASSVPAAVKASFSSQFPAAANIEWRKLNNSYYKAQFSNGGKRWEVTYTSAGAQVKLELAS